MVRVSPIDVSSFPPPAAPIGRYKCFSSATAGEKYIRRSGENFGASVVVHSTKQFAPSSPDAHQFSLTHGEFAAGIVNPGCAIVAFAAVSSTFHPFASISPPLHPTSSHPSVPTSGGS